MKIYASSPELDMEQIVSKIIGKDIWVRAYSREDDSDFYIQVLSETEFNISYYGVNVSYLETNRLFTKNDWLYIAHSVRRQGIPDFYWDFSPVTPVEYLTSDELQDLIFQRQSL